MHFRASLQWTFRAIDGAATRGRFDIVKTLFDTRTEGCSTEAFVGAASNGHLEVLYGLMHHYPELYNATTCLLAAAEHGQADVVEFIKEDADAGYYPGYGLGLAVETAAAEGHVEVLNTLKPWPIDLTRAFNLAAVHGHVHVLEVFCEDANVQAWSALLFGMALKEAAARGHCAVVEFLVRRSRKVDIGKALHAAARFGQTEVVKLILRTREVDEATVLCALKGAAGNARYDVVEFLLEQAARENRHYLPWEAGGSTIQSVLSDLLQSVVRRGDIGMVGILVKHCPVLLIGPELGKAATSGNAAIVKLLLDTCAAKGSNDPSLGDTVGTAAANALSCGDIAMAKVLLAFDPCNGGLALTIAARKNHLGLVNMCAEKSDHSYKIDALIQAAQDDRIDIMEMLIAYLDQTSIAEALKRIPSDVNPVVLRVILNKSEPKLYPNIFIRAATRGFLGLVECLQNEVDAHSIRWALMNAALNGHAEVVAALLRRSDSASIGCALEATAMRSQLDVVDVLRDRSDAADINRVLTSAVAVCKTEVVQLLTSKKPRMGC